MELPVEKNFDFFRMSSELHQNNLQQPYQAPYHSAANPFSAGMFGGAGMQQPYPQYGNQNLYSGYGGGMSSFGYGGGYNPMMGGEQMWQGMIGQTAEGLGRLNNLLSMTGMLFEHISNHGKLLYSKGVEFHSFVEAVRNWGQSHSVWMENLGLQIESSWHTNEDEETRRRRMLVRRVRTMIIVAFFLSVFYFLRRKQRISKLQQWESIYHHPGFRR